MEALLNSLISNKILIVILIFLISLLIYSIIKRIVKLIVILIIALVLYIGYMNYTGQKLDPALQNYLDKGGKDLKELQQKKEKIGETLDTVNKLNNQAGNITTPGKK